MRGFVHEAGAFDPAQPIIERTLARAASEGIGDVHQLEQMLTRDIGRWSHKTFRRSPLIISIVIDA